MPRTYVRKPYSRQYKNYSIETLNEALDEIKSKKISIRAASVKYGIHRSSLMIQLNEKIKREKGGKNVFSLKEELLFIKHITSIPMFGFPLIINDLPVIMKSYLDQRKQTVKIFKDNLPNLKWVNVFIERHKNAISHKIVKNIYHSRAIINEKIVNRFFNHLERKISGVPPCNIWNFDETNLIDDPESINVMVRRRTKYPEKIKKISEPYTKLFVCGNADGEMAPLCLNPDDGEIWNNWTRHDPDNVRHKRLKAEWFDFRCFQDWFVDQMFPLLNKQDGKKIILCNSNFSSHFNLEVITRCNDHNITFISLPPKAGQLLEPLETGFFKPVRAEWKKLLSAWKSTPSGHKYSVIPKVEFLQLLSQLLHNLRPKSAENLVSGFQKCGIYPLDRGVALHRLVSHVIASNVARNPSLSDKSLSRLKVAGNEIKKTKGIQQKSKNTSTRNNHLKLSQHKQSNTDRSKKNVQGNNITDLSSDVIGEDNFLDYKSHQFQFKSDPLSTTVCLRNPFISSLSNSFDCSNKQIKSEFDDTVMEELSFGDFTVIKVEELSYDVGEFIVIKCDGEYYPGRIQKMHQDTALVNTMIKRKDNWTWPKRPDLNWYNTQDLKAKIEEPKINSDGDLFEIPEINQFIMLDNLFL